MPVFEIIDHIVDVEVIARGAGIQQLRQLVRAYGGRNWRKLKGITRVRLRDGRVLRAEVHWYEAHGVGKKRIKIKRFLS
jgi:hypothetical protein